MNLRIVVVACFLVGAAQSAAAKTVAVTVEVMATGALTFVPADISINVGDSVHWTGLMGGFHTVAEVDDGAAIVWNGGFHSAAAASEFTFTFNTLGVNFYICEPHVLAGMRGTVTVGVEPVPAASQWGLVVMALLVLGTATLIIVRRHRASPSGC